MLLLANSPNDLHILLDIALAYLQDGHYTIHPTKSMITVFGRKSSPEVFWSLGETTIPTVDSCKHLGIERITQDKSNSSIINQCISTARRASYALNGCWLLWQKWLQPYGDPATIPAICRVTLHIWT